MLDLTVNSKRNKCRTQFNSRTHTWEHSFFAEGIKDSRCPDEGVLTAHRQRLQILTLRLTRYIELKVTLWASKIFKPLNYMNTLDDSSTSFSFHISKKVKTEWHAEPSLWGGESTRCSYRGRSRGAQHPGRLTAILNSSSRGFQSPCRPPWAWGMRTVHICTCRQNTYMHKNSVWNSP